MITCVDVRLEKMSRAGSVRGVGNTYCLSIARILFTSTDINLRSNRSLILFSHSCVDLVYRTHGLDHIESRQTFPASPSRSKFYNVTTGHTPFDVHRNPLYDIGLPSMSDYLRKITVESRVDCEVESESGTSRTFRILSGMSGCILLRSNAMP